MKRGRDEAQHSVRVASDMEAVAARDMPERGRGWLLARGLLSADLVKEARRVVCEALAEAGDIAKEDVMAALPARDSVKGLLDRQDVAARISNVLEASELRELVARECGGDSEVAVVPYKWLRAVGKGLHTGWHVDRTYLEEAFGGEMRLMSCWIPLGTIGPQNGGLVLCEGSEDVRKVCTFRKLGRDGTRSGWAELTREQLSQCTLYSAIYQPGDVVLFDSDVVHCTAVNLMHNLRLSCDVRFLIGPPRAVDASVPKE